MTHQAHGAQVEVTRDAIVLHYSPLATSLGRPATESIALSAVTGTRVSDPSDLSFGSVLLTGADFSVRFAPHQDARGFAAAVEAALRGQAPGGAASVAGLDYTAVDVETANQRWGSVCQIGAVRFRDGVEVDSHVWLCCPPPPLGEFAAANTAVHGITAADVQGAPEFSAAAGELLEFLGEDVLVAHNVKFDSSALRDAMLAAGVPVPRVHLACSLALARRASRNGELETANHRLPSVAAALGIEEFSHHDALADARAAGRILAALAARWGHSGSVEALCAAQGFALGIMSEASLIPLLDAHTAPRTAAEIGAGTDFAGAPGGSSTAEPARSGSRAPKGGGGGRPPWQAVATPQTVPDPNPDADPQGPLFGQNVTLTGDFAPYDKGTLWSGIAARGGQVSKNVTKKTTLLVCGQWATPTSKEKRARQLIEQGQAIELWDKERLFGELQLGEAPPF